MNKEELISFLKEYMRIEVSVKDRRSCEGRYQVLKTEILIGDVLITEKECEIFYIGPDGVSI